VIKSIPLTGQVAAISCGIYQGTAVLDLDYDEDSNAEVDANFVLTGNGTIVEVQATAEEKAFQRTQFNELYALAENGISNLINLQKNSLRL
jgi:ribonuclease PH